MEVQKKQKLDCQYCARSFARVEHLQRHVRTRESADAIGQSFEEMMKLTSQMKDTKEKPFHCSCGRSFTRNDLLKRHKARDHTTTRHNVGTPSTSSTPPLAPPGSGGNEPSLSQPASHYQDDNIGVTPRSMGQIDQETSGSSTCLDVFQEFTNFMESAGLDPSWDNIDLQMFHTSADISMPSTSHIADLGTPAQQVSSTELSIDDGDEMADLVPSHTGRTQPHHHNTSSSSSWRISEASRQVLQLKLAAATPANSSFRLPSRHALSRYFQSYSEKFHKHFPMLHLPTYAIDEAPPELSIAVAAIGAQYRFEMSNACELYRAAKSIAWEWLQTYHDGTSMLGTTIVSSVQSCRNSDRICIIILLIAFSSWMNEPGLLSDALRMQSPLAYAIRQDGLAEAQHNGPPTDWTAWVRTERRRRAKLIGFAYLNLQAIKYDLPPQIFANEIDLLLPCSSFEWEAKTSTDWHQVSSQQLPASLFQHSLQILFSSSEAAHVADGIRPLSPLALFLLLQAIIQKIILARQLQSAGETALRECDLNLLESALHHWKGAWRRDPGSTLDPQNIDGPLAFTSVAFLALAFTRLHSDHGARRFLGSQDYRQMAASISQTQPPIRGPRVVTALLHAVHALSLPARMGVDYVAQSQVFYWSCMHSLCALECGVFVWMWLQQVEIEAMQATTTVAENHIICWIRALVKECLESLEPSDLGLESDNVECITLPQLGVAVLRIWSRVLSRNALWPDIRLISETLHALAQRDTENVV